jgi:hypothetical protein
MEHYWWHSPYWQGPAALRARFRFLLGLDPEFGNLAIARLERLVTQDSLDLSGLDTLRALPAELEVHGDLDLSGCSGLRSLPRLLRVERNLMLRDCAGFTSLPGQLEAGTQPGLSWIDLRGCTSWDGRAPSLERSHSTLLTDADPDWTRAFQSEKELAGPWLNLWRSGGTEARDRAVLEAVAWVQECLNEMDARGEYWVAEPRLFGFLLGLEEDLREAVFSAAGQVLGERYIQVRNLPGLASLPKSMKAGFLEIRDCPELVTLPEGLELASLEIVHCRTFACLPESMAVEGSLEICDCNQLRTLRRVHFTPSERDGQAPGVRLGGPMRIRACDALASLADGSSFGYLFIDSCRSLTTLPRALRITEGMTIFSCPGFASLPKDLVVESRDARVEFCDTWDGVIPPGAGGRGSAWDRLRGGLSTARTWLRGLPR